MKSKPNHLMRFLQTPHALLNEMIILMKDYKDKHALE